MAVAFIPGTNILSTFAGSLANTVVVSRDAAGLSLVDSGAVVVQGGTPTVADTALAQAFGLNANDALTLGESNGAPPSVNVFGGIGADILNGGAGDDTVVQ